MRIKVSARFWTQFKQQARVWRVGILPGLTITGLVVVARLTGSLQVLEWMTYDALLRVRPLEPPDAQIVIVGINETDIKAVGKYPIPDRELATLLQILQSYQPRAIGLDLFRNLTSDPHRAELSRVFRESPNLIGIETALGAQSGLLVPPPPELPPDRVGIADAVLDPDGKLRRSLLASKVDSGETKYSLSLLLAERYLRGQGISLQYGPRASDPIQLGDVVVPRVRPTTGGYTDVKSGGHQIMLSFRSNPHPFPTVSLIDVLTHKVDAALIRDHIVLIGMTAASVNDTFMTAATQGTLLTNALGNTSDQYQLIYGVEVQAHAISQLVNAAQHRRSLIQTWADIGEYIWIIVWGTIGVALGLLLQSPWKTLLSLGIGSVCLTGCVYGLIALSWWVPLVPALLALCAAGLTTSLFDRDSRTQLEQRSLTFKRTYDAVHNGPLQTLAAMLRGLDDLSPDALRSQLHALNRELRSVYESMHQAILTGDQHYAQTPIDDLLYQIYDDTLKRDLPGFASIKTFIPPDFSPLKDCPLSVDQKQALCLYLQEALCNVGNHATCASCLDVVCKRETDWYMLRVIDNGSLPSVRLTHPRSGRGTDQAKELAKSLRGKFQRRQHAPQGMVCELIWPSTKPYWQIVFHPFQSLPKWLRNL